MTGEADLIGADSDRMLASTHARRVRRQSRQGQPGDVGLALEHRFDRLHRDVALDGVSVHHSRVAGDAGTIESILPSELVAAMHFGARVGDDIVPAENEFGFISARSIGIPAPSERSISIPFGAA